MITEEQCVAYCDGVIICSNCKETFAGLVALLKEEGSHYPGERGIDHQITYYQCPYCCEELVIDRGDGSPLTLCRKSESGM